MKTILLKSSSFLIFLSLLSFFNFKLLQEDHLTIKGKVTDPSMKPLSGVNIFVNDTKKGTISDIDGLFEMRISKNAKKLTFITSGYKKLILSINGKEFYEAILNVSEKPLYSDRDEHYKDAEYEVGSVKHSKSEALKSAPSPPPPHASYSPSPVSEIKTVEEAEFFDSDGSSDVISADKRKEHNSEKSKSAGQLTAGEWNDLNNWEDWKKLIDEADYKEMGTYWGINAKNRISIYVSNKYELPIADCEVILKSGKSIIWSAKTDNSGKAELWSNKIPSDSRLIVRSSTSSKEIINVKTIDKGVNLVRFDEECQSSQKAEIMFVVDATGSMGDEIEFLKSELNDVIEQVESSRSTIDFKWGSVFYRDASDEYLTRQSPLNSNKDKVINFIKMQGAGGGGDYPEAVNEGLEEALLQEWSENAIARIIFLVLDAPPHHNPEVISDLKSQIELAAALGIKIIPITASGINRQTEYLMKFMSIQTNGTYVFLTDHSGIGNAHLDPVVKDYEVEKLNDLLVRLIDNYSDPGRCTVQLEDDPIFTNIEIYPNPAINTVQVKVPSGVEKISLSTSSGQIVYKENIKEQCDISLNLSAFVDGMYLVNFHTSSKVYSYKLIKSNKA